jgi:hypothetical protein
VPTQLPSSDATQQLSRAREVRPHNCGDVGGRRERHMAGGGIERKERREERERVLTSWPHRHMASTSGKLPDAQT